MSLNSRTFLLRELRFEKFVLDAKLCVSLVVKALEFASAKPHLGLRILI